METVTFEHHKILNGSIGEWVSFEVEVLKCEYIESIEFEVIEFPSNLYIINSKRKTHTTKDNNTILMTTMERERYHRGR